VLHGDGVGELRAGDGVFRDELWVVEDRPKEDRFAATAEQFEQLDRVDQMVENPAGDGDFVSALL